MHEHKSWETTLAEGQPMRYPLQPLDRMEGLEGVSGIWVQALPMSGVSPGDVVLCRQGRQIRLRRVFRTRVVSGLPCLEIVLGDQSMVTRFLSEGAYLGKMVPCGPAALVRSRPDVPVPLWWDPIVNAARMLVGI